MQLEINHLWRKLRRKRWGGTPSSLEPSSDDDRDDSYRPKSKTPPSESFRAIRIAIISREVRVHLAKVWVMMLWAGLWTRFLSHLLHVGLKEENFLGGLLNQHSPCIMVEQTMWSTLATSTREWLFTQRMRPWCARCSHLVWGLWRWDGSTNWKKVLITPLRSLLGHLWLVL